MNIAGLILEANLFNALDENEIRSNVRIQQKQLRDASNPFEVAEETFVKWYRVPKELVLYVLMPLLEPHMNNGVRSNYIPKYIRILITLNFLTFGNYQKSVGKDYQLSASQSIVSKAINEVTKIFTDELLHVYVQFPTNAKMLKVKNEFLRKFRFPNICGALDCTHIAIVAPPTNHPTTPAIAYYNRKGYYSINVQVVCDANLRISAINARYPGATHDAAIWASSSIRNFMKGQFENNQTSWLLGDNGYPLEPWLLTPILDAGQNTPEERYTKAHLSARNSIERCFGVLKQRFRCLLKHRVLHYSPTVAGQIVYTCAILHNICIENNVEFIEDLNDDEGMELNEDVEENINIIDNNWLGAGRRIRNNVIRNHFM